MEGLMKYLPFLALFVVMYFFMIRPQMKRQKEEKKFGEGLKVGDKVITKSGLHGKIHQLSGDSCVIETMSGKLKFELSAISMEMSSKLHTTKAVDKK
ncbi:preprotein translocase subunit YajC [Pustulibacterium marinum]|uniref:Sec translocon accessory complex subunit YajC n=1 Tax=Pustulibacterium marinum TaxID=1224947 RepID=A0A1I7G5H9_9FLAO|nr:preprotein translocase subunit YajC [Pustulibacterium marinum]SFU43725.1 preprotein translocase subunit YajC [Pustulibacterium marinum]